MVFVTILRMLPHRIVTLGSLVIIFWAFIYAFFVFDPASITDSENISGRQIFQAKIIDIDRRLDKTFLVVKPLELTEHKIRVTIDNFYEFNKGQVVKISGEVEAPENFEGFNYQGWLAKDNIAYVIFRPDITVEGGGISIDAKVKNILSAGINKALLPPASSLYSAMLIGDKGEFTQENRNNLASSGLSHIVAISGLHITIITTLLISVGIYLGLWRRSAGWVAIALIVFYIWMIGTPASAVRAGIMASTVFLAERFGRPSSSWRALLLAAAVMLAFNPLLIRYDVGFQLSFLAVMGILLFARKIEPYISKVPNILHAREVLSMSISAQIFTAPLVLFIFGTFAPFGVLANILVVTILPAVLIAGFIASVAGVLGGPFTVFGAMPAWALSKYIWGVISILG